MQETNQESTNPEEQDVSSPEGENDVSTDQGGETGSGDSSESKQKPVDLGYIKKVTGREFKSVEDFEKHYKELSSFVGKNPKELKDKADSFDRIMTEANAAVKSAENGEKTNLQDSEVSQLKAKVQEMEFLGKHPEAKNSLELIASVAKGKGVSLEEAYESGLKDLITSKSESEKAKEQEQFVGVESKSRISQGKANKINELAQKVVKSDSVEDKEALVREFLSK